MSQFQDDLRTKLVTYLNLNGYPFTPSDLEGLLGVVRRVILENSDTAVVDCGADSNVLPDSEV